MAFVSDTLRLTGLDTLSERALRRLTDRWTGELYPVDSLDVTHHAEAASPQTFTQIVEEWQRAREMYHDADVEAVMGGGSSLSQGVVSMADSVATPSLTPLYDAEVMLAERGGWSLAGWSDELFNLLVAVMFVYYLFCVCRYFDDIKALFESIFNSKIQHTGRAGERRRSDIFYGSLGKLFMLGARIRVKEPASATAPLVTSARETCASKCTADERKREKKNTSEQSFDERSTRIEEASEKE